ncbi:hypothetical protein KAU09_02490 [Candidatus Parcubacteria bacterium]|nr:hypothetical protein [Candidatus Parcubacteria bacterium]
MTLEEIMDKASNDFELEIKMAIGRSVKTGGALADVEEELIEISKKLEKAGVCSYDDFYTAFLNAHSEIIGKMMRRK